MTIKIIYFASLREKIGHSEDLIKTDAPITTAKAWTLATGQTDLPENVLIAINHEYVNPESLVKAGDELAFFPPVTGG
ncbi:MAG: molybdopterin converting factor subunit 1 [Thiotrichaceae bacterium]